MTLTISDLYRMKVSQDCELKPEARGHSKGQKVYIASQFRNNEALLRRRWNKQLLDLVRYFGPNNVYVSIYESGSWDDSEGALEELDAQLQTQNVSRSIILDPRTRFDSITQQAETPAWIRTPRGRTELRRIPYLAQLRNRLLEPFHELASAGETFDVILFSNDVIFEASGSVYTEVSLI